MPATPPCNKHLPTLSSLLPILGPGLQWLERSSEPGEDPEAPREKQNRANQCTGAIVSGLFLDAFAESVCEVLQTVGWTLACSGRPQEPNLAREEFSS
jgi:hypothetical protein